MPSAIIRSDVYSAPSSNNEDANVFMPFFAPNGTQFTLWNPNWYVEYGEEMFGDFPDTWVVKIPSANDDDFFPAMGLNPDGPIQDLTFDCPVVIKRAWKDQQGVSHWTVVGCGYIQTIEHAGGSMPEHDFLTVTCTSAKKLMRDISLIGHYCWDGTAITFREGIPLCCNPGGRPNWTFDTAGNPWMAVNPDWGLTSDETPPLATAIDSTAATYCTLGMLTTYLKNVYGPIPLDAMATAESAAKAHYPGLKRLPSSGPFEFIWPDNLASVLDTYYVENFNNAIGQNNAAIPGARKGRDMEFKNGTPLVSRIDHLGGINAPGILDQIFESSGGFSWALTYGDSQTDMSNAVNYPVTLTVVPTRIQSTASSIPLYYGEGDESAISSPLVTEWSYKESVEGVYTRVVGIGNQAKVETRVSTSIIGGDNGLTRGFDTNTAFDHDFGKFLLMAAAGTTPARPWTTPEQVQLALTRYQSSFLFTRYLLSKTFQVESGTSFNFYPQANAPLRVEPNLLSFQGVNEQDPTGANDFVPYPIRTETSIDGTTWDTGPELDGLINWDNGYIEFPAFADIGFGEGDNRIGAIYWPHGQYHCVSVGGTMQLDLGLRDVRATIAVNLDSALTGTAKNPFDGLENGDENLYTVIPDSPDALRFDSGFSRTLVMDLQSLYELWLRYSSYPIPETAGGTQFPDYATFINALRTDASYLLQHCNKALHDRNRLVRSGYFRYDGWLVSNGFEIGKQISDIRSIAEGSARRQPFTLNCVIGGRRWRTENIGSSEKPLWKIMTEIVPA